MGNERVKNLKNEVEGVKNIMTQNVERILARGENLDHLRNKTEDLEATVGFHTLCCGIGISIMHPSFTSRSRTRVRGNP